MEFIQFHPTALKNSAVLISESARGAGGKLLNSKDERFVDELKPRDQVSLAIYEQILNNEDVFLDITHLGEEFIDKELPQERKLAKLYEGIDPVNQKIPIKPAAHYSMGGIKVDTCMQTNIKNLFAVGECCESGVHGANRLGGNSLLEIVVFGKIAGEEASKCINENSFDENIYIEKTQKELDEILSYEAKINFYKKKKELGDMFYKNCGIKREAKKLNELLNFIEELKKDLKFMGLKDKSKNYNKNLIDFLEFKNILVVATQVAKSALENKSSVGAHIREDI